jgi:signal transduction histidine kinase
MAEGRTTRAQLRLASQWLDPEISAGIVQLIDSMGMALFVLDETGVLRLATPRAGEFLALSVDDLIGRAASELPPPARAIVETARRARRGQREPLSVTLADGRVRDLGVTVEPAGASSAAGPRVGELHGTLVAFQDLTPIHELQEQRDRLLKMATVGEVLPSLLHELKNPFAAIASSVELLIEETTDPRAQEDLHAILVEVRRAVLSLDGLGFVGRELRCRTPMAIDHAVREACHLLGGRATRARIELRCEGPDLPLLPLDAAAMRALLFNLVNNAIQACRAGGRVVVGFGLVGDVFELTVRDDGAGMSPETLARCTELFFTTKRAGSGIGLALCRKVAEEGGGNLEILSTLGQGTSVTLRVPTQHPRNDSRHPSRHDARGKI